MRTPIRKITFAAVVAAMYAGLSLAAAAISFGPIQLRVSEALCVLPFFIPCSGWGLFVGCVVANMIGGAGLPDVVFGSLATLLAALATSKIKNRVLACAPPPIINGIVVGAVLAKMYSPGAFWAAYPLYAAQVFAGEAVVMYALGLPLTYLLPKINFFARLQRSLKK